MTARPRPRLALVPSEPAPQPATLPPMQYLDPEWAKALAKIRAGFAQASRPFVGSASPRAAVAQARTELFALATELQKFARKLPQ